MAPPKPNAPQTTVPNARSLVLLSGACLAVLLAATPIALADDFIIVAPEVTTNGGFVLNGGDTLTVTGPAGAIDTGGAGEHAIEASGGGNLITIEAGHQITTLGADADGVVLLNPSTGSTVINAGSILAAGANADGMTGDGHDNTYVNSGLISSAGATGINVRDTGRLTVTNTGGIAGDVWGISAFAWEVATVTNGPGATIVTSGSPGAGIVAGISGGGPGLVSVTNASSIVTAADTSEGILVMDGGTGNGTEATLTVNHSGFIGTSGNNAEGIQSEGGAVADINSSGEIVTIGDNADGIAVIGTGNNDLAATISHSGTITTGAGVDADGIRLSEAATATVYQTGTIVTTGNLSNGIEIVTDALSTAAEFDLINSGMIETSGDTAAGVIFLDVDSGTIDQRDTVRIDNSGTIVTNGLEAYGIATQGGAQVEIASSGTIATSGPAHAIYVLEAAEASVANSGMVSTTDNGASGIVVVGLGLGGVYSVNNSGTIASTGVSSAGIDIDTAGDPGGQVTNSASGEIITDGDFSTGILLSGGENAVVHNAGLIASTSGGVMPNNWRGIFVTGARSEIVHTGRISGDGTSFLGITVNGADDGSIIVGNGGVITNPTGDGIGLLIRGSMNHMATNDGTIRGNITGVLWDGGSNNSFVNNGLVAVIGGNDAVNSAAAATTVRNTGTLISTGGYAVFLDGADSRLELTARSTLIGGLSFSDPGSAELDIGLPNAVLTFDAGLGGTEINTHGNPYVIDGNTIHVVDRDGFDAVAQSAEATTRATADQLAAQRGYIFGDPVGGRGRQVWASGLATLGADENAGRFLLGATFQPRDGSELDLFIGRSGSGIETVAGATEIESETLLIGGAWGQRTRFGFIDFLLMAGRTEFDGTRNIANNGPVVTTGYEQAHSGYESSFANASVTVGTNWTWAGRKVTPSLRLAYTGQSIEAYDESSASAGSNLSVDERITHSAQVRAQVGTSFAAIETGAGTWNLSTIAGLGAAFTGGDDAVVTTAGGQTMTIGTAQNGLSLQAFLGGRAAFDLHRGGRFHVTGTLGAGSAASGTAARAAIGAGYALSF